MTAPEPHASPTAPRDRDWSWNASDDVDALLEHGGWDAVATAHAWYDGDTENNPPQKKTAYKLPHHDLVDGELRVVWAGVNRAMNALAGGRGGTDLPEDEIDAVYAHLARHYEEFDEEPPALD